jgi:hypothetical protein
LKVWDLAGVDEVDNMRVIHSGWWGLLLFAAIFPGNGKASRLGEAALISPYRFRIPSGESFTARFVGVVWRVSGLESTLVTSVLGVGD